MKETALTVWRLAKGHDRRVREGHPWIFSNELQTSPKGLEPGSLVRIEDCRGEFLGYGYGNPHSLIAARIVTLDEKSAQWNQVEWLGDRILTAWRRRASLGVRFSQRLVFGESDGLPGLILDRYEVQGEKGRAQVLAVQITTAGMERQISSVEGLCRNFIERAFSEELTNLDWSRTALVLRNDTSVRALEGLEDQSVKVIKALPELNLEDVEIIVGQREAVRIRGNLVNGQKTGLFLDQSRNIQLLADLLNDRQSRDRVMAQSAVRILDLCCYVGQWSVQLNALLDKSKYEQRIFSLVDVSGDALSIAKRNLGDLAETVKLDVFAHDFPFPENSFDVVICDPPALIKSRKTIEPGKHGYTKLIAKALKMVKPGGVLVSCSCSGLLSDEEFIACTRKSFRKVNRGGVLLFKGGHGLDHPQRLEFPEASYLKVHVYQVD